MPFDASEDQRGEGLVPGQAQAPGQPNLQLSGGGGGFAGTGAAPGPTSGGTAGSPTTPSTSGQWTNLNAYLTANADQSPQLGNQIANTVGTQAAQAQTDLGNLQTGFQNQTPYQNLNNTTSGQIDSAINNPSQYTSPTGANTTQADVYLNGPSAWGITPTVGNIQQYAPTSGPTYSSVQNDYTTANQNLADTQSESGRDLLLQNTYGNNGINYSPGEQNFDQLLLQQNPSNQTALNQVYNQYAPTETLGAIAGSTDPTAQAAYAASQPLDLYNLNQNATNYATNEENQANAYQTEAIGDLNNQIGNLGTNVQNELTADQASYLNPYNQLLQSLQQNDLSQTQANQLGIKGNPILYNTVKPANYLTPTANPYSAQSQDLAATTPDWQNFTGLQNLIGGMQGNQVQQAALAGTGLTGTQATAPTAPASYTFDQGGFQAAGNNAQAGYDAAANQSVSIPGVAGTASMSQWQNIANSLPAGSADKPLIEAAVNAFNQAQGVNNTLIQGSPQPLGNHYVRSK